MSPTIAMTGSIQKNTDVAATSTGNSAMSTLPVSSTIICVGGGIEIDEGGGGEGEGRRSSSSLQGVTGRGGGGLDLFLRRAANTNIGEVAHAQIVRR